MSSQNLGPQLQTQNPIDWTRVKRILVVKLRSIGDTVLSTPSLIALRRFVPDAQIDILLEDWVVPLLEGHDAIDNVVSVGKGTSSRLRIALKLWKRDYDVAFNLHGGTTASFFTAASRVKHRVGYTDYRYSFLYNHLLSSSADFWQTEFTHSAEQQLALLGFVGVPVGDRPKSKLVAGGERAESIDRFLNISGLREKRIGLIHPASAFKTKQWSPENFAETIDYLRSKDIFSIVVAGPDESYIIDEIKSLAKTAFHGFSRLTLPEITALAARAEIFVGNDSGIAHIAAAVGTPTVVVFGSSNRNHWRPWTNVPNEIVFEEFTCQPCPGYECKEFGEPRCILSVKAAGVQAAIERVLDNRALAN